jgi:uncharacterized protein YdeI (YjbR/CyaY-like superfamily)
MGTRDPRVDAYIAKSAEFARPILDYLRDVVHEGCPDVQETIKWGAPFFEYKGVMCMMAAFKQHCSFGFWNASLVVGKAAADGDSAGQFGKIRKISDLPPKKQIIAYVRKAMQLNEDGVKSPSRSKDRPRKPDIPVPPDFAAALKKNRKAQAVFDAFPPGQRREYLQWITEARTDATRKKRMDTAIEWIAEGKGRNWKYQR